MDKMVQPRADNDFHHWEKRLSLQFNPTDAGHAVILLNLSAHKPSGRRAERR